MPPPSAASVPLSVPKKQNNKKMLGKTNIQRPSETKRTKTQIQTHFLYEIITTPGDDGQCVPVKVVPPLPLQQRCWRLTDCDPEGSSHGFREGPVFDPRAPPPGHFHPAQEPEPSPGMLQEREDQRSRFYYNFIIFRNVLFSKS